MGFNSIWHWLIVLAIVLILFGGGAWVVVDRLGTLPAIVGWLVERFAGRGLWVIPIVAMFFGTMGALENMQEEIIPLIPVLMTLGMGIGVDAVTVVAMSMGSAFVGASFGPANPFMAGIALKLAQLPPFGRGGLRLAMFLAGMAVWIAVTMRHAARNRVVVAVPLNPGATPGRDISRRHVLILAIVLAPLAAYVYGSQKLDWGFNELSAGLLIAGIAAGTIGGMGVAPTVTNFLDGMMSVLPAAVMVGVARSISIVLVDGRVVDTILDAMVTPLAQVPALVSVLLMIPFQALLHIPVPSNSGQAVLTMPLFAPIADLLGFSREAAVISYQTGAGLMELITPTNGSLMAALLAAGIPLQRWLRFVVLGFALLVLIGAVSAAFAM